MKKSLLILLSYIMLFCACKKVSDSPSWDVAVKGPLLHASMGIENLLPDVRVVANPDSTLNIIYDTDVFHVDVDSIFQIPDTTIPTFYSWQAFPFPVNPNATFYSSNNHVTLGISGVQLNRMTVRSGKLKIDIRNPLPAKIKFTYTIPGASLNGHPFQVIQKVDSGSHSSPGLFTGIFDLSGYSLDLSGTGTQFNTLNYSVIASADSSAQTFSLIFGDTVMNLHTSMLDIVPSYARGYLGQNTINNSQESNVGIGKLIRGGSILIDSVKMLLSIDNGIGADAQAFVRSIKSANSLTGDTVDLVAPSVLNRYFNINRASETGNPLSPVNETHTLIQLDNTNSNITAFIENIPDVIKDDLTIGLNPIGNHAGYNDFVYTDYLVNTHLHMEMPLKFAANELMLVDTENFIFSDLTDPANIGQSTLTLLADNGFPFSVRIQLILLDQSNNVLDSLFSPAPTVAAAPVGGNGIVSGITRTELSVPVNADRKAKITAARKMAIRSILNTDSYPLTRSILSTYKIQIKLIADGIYTVH